MTQHPRRGTEQSDAGTVRPRDPIHVLIADSHTAATCVRRSNRAYCFGVRTSARAAGPPRLGSSASKVMLSAKAISYRIDQGRELIAVMREHARLARRDTGKGFVSQAIEILRLRRGVGKLDPDEYYQYGLYNDQRFTWPEKEAFLGRRMEDGLIPILDESWWLGLANDKVIAYAFLQGLGFPIPEMYGVYDPTRSCGKLPTLRTAEAAGDFIRRLERPFIAKPIFGMGGRNVWAVRGHDRSRDMLVLTSGAVLAVDDFVDKLNPAHEKGGMLVQELLAPHPAISELCGDRLCTVRLVTIVDTRGARIIAALWRIATGNSMTDNYRRGAGTTLVGPIDPATGVLGRTSSGTGRGFRYVDRHPDTGQSLPGFSLPDWHSALSLGLSATAAIPRLAMQAWDVALTSRGPVLLEVNVNGGMHLPQICAGAGLFRGEFAEFLRHHRFPAQRQR